MLISLIGGTCLLLVCMCPALSAQERPSKNVLTIHAGDEFFPSNPVLDAAIRTTLVSGDKVTVDYFADNWRLPASGRRRPRRPFSRYVRRKFRNRHIDLVIAITNDSLQFVLDHRELFPDAPIVFAGLAVPDESARRDGHGIAAVRVGSAYAQTLKLALAQHPSTGHVFVVAGSPSRANVDAVQTELGGFSPRVQMTYVNVDTLASLRDAVTPRLRIVSFCTSGSDRAKAGPWTLRHRSGRRRDSHRACLRHGGSQRWNRDRWRRRARPARNGNARRADRARDSRRKPAAGHCGRGRTTRADVRWPSVDALEHRSVPAPARLARPLLRA